MIVPITGPIKEGDLLHLRLWARVVDPTKRGEISVVVEEDGRIAEWDAVNHIVGWGPTTFADVTGGPGSYAKTIRLGRDRTDAEMWINEGNIIAGSQSRADYLAMVDKLAKRGAKPYGVGFMGHFGADELASPKRIYSVFDRFAAKGVNLQLTELDVAAGGDDRLQADFYRDVITIAFSHPAMEGGMLWGFWEGRHWRPETALWRRDWSVKPAGKMWQRLIHEKWWTDTETITDQAGRAAIDGFHGTYAITARHNGREKRLVRGLGNEGATIAVRLD